ncbi:MAG: ABC transporter permease [Prevotella sp.]|nr:ABC transporter permease [Prevotella sp.]
MNKYWLLARSNLRKSKGQTIAIVVLVFLTAVLLNLWLMLAMDYRANFDRYHDELNAEHVILTVNSNDDTVRNFLTEKLDADRAVAQYRCDPCLRANGGFAYNGGEMNSELVFMRRTTAVARDIGQSDIVSDSTFASGVYLPMLYQSADVDLGKTLAINIGSHTVTYTICGFFNNAMMGSHNCVLTQIILSDDQYATLEQNGYAATATLCAVRLNDAANNLSYKTTLKTAIADAFPQVATASDCYDAVAQARYVAQNICAMVLMALAFIVLLIAVVVIASNIANYIQVNLKNLGVMKALGFTSRQLISTLLLQFLGVTLLAAVLGVAVAYAVFPALNAMMMAQTGIPYAMRFLPLPLLITFGILGGTVALSVWLAARRMKKIEPIAALRAGEQTHHVKHNHVPLASTKLTLNFALALKTTLGGWKQNLTIVITMLVLSLVVVFSGLMTENVIMNIDPFLDLIAGETADSCINLQTETESEFIAAMEADPRVEKVYLYHTENVAHVDGAELTATISNDYRQANNQTIVYTGNFPKTDAEIAIAGKYAQEQGFRIGDQIAITANGKTATYQICGLTQGANNLGRDCLLTRTGYEKLGALTQTSYYLNLVAGTDIDAFNAAVKAEFADGINSTVNVDAIIAGSSSVYVVLLTAIVVVILLLAIVIITFVLYLLVRTMLNNKQRDYGVLKALGFTTKQLIVQTALTLMPALILSTVVGLVIGCAVINPLMSLFLSSLGIVKCTFSIPITFSVLVGMGLILLSFGIACLLSLRIKQIAPRNLLLGE